MAQRIIKNPNIDLIVAVGIAILAIAGSGVGLSSPLLRVFYAIPMALCVPGYAITTASFPGRILKPSQFLLFCLAFSLTIDIVVGLALNWLPGGLQPLTWALILGAVTLVACFVSYLRRKATSPSASVLAFPMPRLASSQVLLLGLAVVFVFGAILVSSIGANQQLNGFTQFWLLPAKTENQQKMVQIGVKNQELETVTYKVELKAQDYVIKEWSSVELKPGQTWEETVPLDTPNINLPSIDGYLYRLDTPDKVYRMVTLWRTDS